MSLFVCLFQLTHLAEMRHKELDHHYTVVVSAFIIWSFQLTHLCEVRHKYGLSSLFFNHIVEKLFNCKRTQGCCNLHWEYKRKSTGIPWRNRTSWLLPANLCRQLRRLMLGQGTSHRKWWRCRVLPPDFLKSLNRADSSHACRHSFLADDDLNPFLSSRTARIRHP